VDDRPIGGGRGGRAVAELVDEALTLVDLHVGDRLAMSASPRSIASSSIR
jgi:hypothetical protein